MPNTYTQIHIHTVFGVKYRAAMIHVSWKEELLKYITGIIQKRGHKLIAINCMPDHIHILFGLRPTESISDLMQIVKGDSSEWVNKKGFTKHPFRWQEGYAAFSIDKSLLQRRIYYIENQEKHHEKLSFIDEYNSWLSEIDDDNLKYYLMKPPE